MHTFSLKLSRLFLDMSVTEQIYYTSYVFNNDFIKWQFRFTIILGMESSLEIWAILAIISKYVAPKGVTRKTR